MQVLGEQQIVERDQKGEADVLGYQAFLKYQEVGRCSYELTARDLEALDVLRDAYT